MCKGELMLNRIKTYVCLYEYKDADTGQIRLDYRVMARSHAPKPSEFLLRRQPTGRAMVFEAKVAYDTMVTL